MYSGPRRAAAFVRALTTIDTCSLDVAADPAGPVTGAAPFPPPEQAATTAAQATVAYATSTLLLITLSTEGVLNRKLRHTCRAFSQTMRYVQRRALGCCAALILAGCVDASNVPVPTSLSPLPISGLTLTPASLLFTIPGSAPQTFVATETGFDGPFKLTDNCSPASGTVVTYAPAGGSGPSLKVTVTPVAIGACSITVDDGLQTAAEDVNVGTALSATPNSIGFGSPSSPTQTFTINQPGYTGSFTLTDTCHRKGPVVATYTPSGGSGPSLTVTVSPAAIGECVITATDQASRSVSVTVSVASTTILVQ
jgi:hypothetical protein